VTDRDAGIKALSVTLAVFQEKITIEDYFWGWLDKKKIF